MLNFSYAKLKSSHEGPWIMVDLLMLGLLLINLIWLVFDSLYATQAFKTILSSLSPNIVEGYAPVHDNFALYDLAFIGVFLSEFSVRWMVAVVRKTYMRWYFFPLYSLV